MKESEIEKITMNILENKGKRVFTSVGVSRFSDRAGGGVCPERFIVSAAVIVAGKTKPGGCPKNKKSR